MSRDLMRSALLAPVDDREREVIGELLRTWQTFARPEQLPPDDCRNKFYIGGARGIGKNRSAAELALDRAEDWGAALSGFCAGRTAADTRDCVVYGPSGMLACGRRRGINLDWRPSANLLTHPNGAQWIISSGEVVDAARGKNLNFAWLDELPFWQSPAEALANVELAFRLDAPPPGRMMILTATPNRRAPISFALADDPDITRATVATTKDNLLNLSPAFVAELERKYGGTSLGKAELEGQLIAVDGAVVAQDVIAAHRVQHAPPHDDIRRTIVAWDPGGARSESDEHGIVVVADDSYRHYYVLADESIAGAQTRDVANAIVEIAVRYGAGTVVYEANLAGDAHESLLRTAMESRNVHLRLEPVHATKSKLDRAEPIAMMYEQGRVHHVGIFDKLERQLTQWVAPGKSPDRLDAAVHGIAWLAAERDVGPLFGDDGPSTLPLRLQQRSTASTEEMIARARAMLARGEI
jgi:phage terminase large subunit-like protein